MYNHRLIKIDGKFVLRTGRRVRAKRIKRDGISVFNHKSERNGTVPRTANTWL